MFDFFKNLFFQNSNDNYEPYYEDTEMLTVELCRAYNTYDVTMGMLNILGESHEPIFTLELPWQDNATDISCIPDGQYLCKPHESPSQGSVYKVFDVPYRDHILIHIGNTTDDIEGCILVGASAGTLNGKPAVLNSKNCMKRLMSIIKDREFILEIISV